MGELPVEERGRKRLGRAERDLSAAEAELAASWRCPDCGSGITKVHASAEGLVRCGMPPGHWTSGDTEREHEPLPECGEPDRWSGLPCVREPGHQPPCQAYSRFIAYPNDRVTGKYAAAVLAKALDQFLREAEDNMYAALRLLQPAVEPTLRALGYPKEET